MRNLAYGAAEELRLRKNAVFALCTVAIALLLWDNFSTSAIGALVCFGHPQGQSASDVVNLRWFNIDGGSSGSVNIQFTAGQALVIQKSVVRGFTNTGNRAGR